MKLREALSNHIGEYVKLGAACSHIYCGIAGHDIFEIVEKLSDMELKKKKKARERNNRMGHIKFQRKWAEKLNTGLRRLKTQAQINGWTKEECDAKTKAFITAYERDKEYARKRSEGDTAEDLEAWVGFLDRTVKEIYPSIEKGIVIIFEGNEMGRYWTYDEYERGCDDDEGDVLQTP